MSDGHGKSGSYTPYLNATTFTTTGTWTVPARVTSVQVKAWGAGGDSSQWAGATGGGGGYIQGYMAVTAGDTLAIYIGAAGFLDYVYGDCNNADPSSINVNYGGGGTAVYNGSYKYVIAGGGGGCHYHYSAGGGGGGSIGSNGINYAPLAGGRGFGAYYGTGGVSGNANIVTAGQSHSANTLGFVALGGGPIAQTQYCTYNQIYALDAAGGGGGYAGGGGAPYGGAGGGSSGAGTVSSVITESGATNAIYPGGTGAGDWNGTAGYASGTGGNGAAAQPGCVVIRY